MKEENLEVKYGLPREVKYCRRCVLSNQRPSSMPEFTHTPDRKGAKYLQFDENGICDACRYCDRKEEIDWKKREEELLKLCDQHRKNDGSYDCICPGSGGKDSVYASHLLKYKYGMHPLTVTWPPILYTDYGYKNFRSWLEIGGFDNISFNQNGRVMRLLTKLAIENLLHPFQTFILGQKNLAPKIALQYKIPLVFYGESEGEYGAPIAETNTSLRDKSYFVMRNVDDIWLGGVNMRELRDRYKLSMNDLMAYLPADYKQLEQFPLQVHYMGYYVKWTPQESYYYAVEHTGFQARPHRTEGTYSKYTSIDDKIDDLHYYTTHVKFGLGRASYDASQEVRNKHLTREDGVALVRRFDGEFPERYFKDVMDYLEMKPEVFMELCDTFRSPHLWKKERGDWKLRTPIS